MSLSPHAFGRDGSPTNILGDDNDRRIIDYSCPRALWRGAFEDDEHVSFPRIVSGNLGKHRDPRLLLSGMTVLFLRMFLRQSSSDTSVGGNPYPHVIPAYSPTKPALERICRVTFENRSDRLPPGGQQRPYTFNITIQIRTRLCTHTSST
jgi:hypothetical protein